MLSRYRGDAIITLGGCDKTQPAAIMPLARRNAIGISLCGWNFSRPHLLGWCLNALSTSIADGGSILAGTHPDTCQKLDAASVFEGVGAVSAGLMDIEDLHKIECHALPGPGSCGGPYLTCVCVKSRVLKSVRVPDRSAVCFFL